MKYYIECVDTGYSDKEEELSLEEAKDAVKQLNHYSAFEWKYVELKINVK